MASGNKDILAGLALCICNSCLQYFAVSYCKNLRCPNCGSTSEAEYCE